MQKKMFVSIDLLESCVKIFDFVLFKDIDTLDLNVLEIKNDISYLENNNFLKVVYVFAHFR